MKGTPWTAGLPTVTVASSDQPKPITLIYPYYENAVFLRQQLAWWHTYPAAVRAHLSAIIVDDGSPQPAAPVLRQTLQPFPIRHFRIQKDLRWNWPAARNVGFKHAPNGWCLVTDMDHVIPASTAEAVVYGRHEERIIYGFSRIEHTGEAKAPHPNSWLMTRAMFWKVGGYDETLSGLYGTDGDWRRRCAAVAPIAILADRLVRHEHCGDSSTIRYLRKQPEDAAVKALIAKRGPNWRPKTLSFAYEEVSLQTGEPCLAR